MDAALIRNWNAAVGRSDKVYILGDFTMKPAAAAHAYLSELNGRKYMVRGNHDRFLDKYGQYMNDFEWVKDYFVLKHEGMRFVLFHYPICEWDCFHRGALHLYGHVHNSSASMERIGDIGLAFNVGVDCNDFRPVSITDIVSMTERV
jgi:calcineurin-like phosphoesterase family protein